MPPSASGTRHKLLRRQIRRVFGDEPAMDTAGLEPFFDVVDAAYRQADDDRGLLERSLELTSNELLEQNRRLRQELDERTRIQELLRDELATRRRVEESLRQSVVRLDAAQRIARLGYWTVSLEDGTVFWSDQMFRIFGYEPGEVTPTFGLFASLVPEGTIDRIAGLIQITEAHVTREMLIPITRADGTSRTIRASGEVVRNNEDLPVQINGVCVDVTTEEEYRQELVRAKEHAEAMLRLKSAFLSNMSHELRTPLTGILGYAELLDAEVAEAQKDLVGAVVRGGHRLMDTLNSVLDLAQLESGNYHLDLQPIEARSEAQDTIEALLPLADAKRLRLELVNRPAAAWCHADRNALYRVLNNLVGNAIKFTEAGHVAVDVDTLGTQVVIRVADTGPGIAAEFLPHLFDEFRQASDGHSRQHEGNGLGLTITKRLVELMGGTIEVTSHVGAGSVFEVMLPMPPAVRRSRTASVLDAVA
ncbi:MAG: ATP-binding protein [Bacteroidota bacterium]